MIAYETKTGTITLGEDYLAKLIGNAASSCFGVAGMAPHGKQKLRNIFSKKNYSEKGINITGDIDMINIDLHIIVAYGMNINAVNKRVYRNFLLDAFAVHVQCYLRSVVNKLGFFFAKSSEKNDRNANTRRADTQYQR